MKPSASHRKHAPLSGVRGQGSRLVAVLEDGGFPEDRLFEGANLPFFKCSRSRVRNAFPTYYLRRFGGPSGAQEGARKRDSARKGSYLRRPWSNPR